MDQVTDNPPREEAPNPSPPDHSGDAPAPASRPPRIIALINQKGGVGKTTTCANLGAALAKLGRRVLMIDLDPQAHLSLHLGIDPAALDRSIHDLLIDDEVTADQVVQTVSDHMALLPAEVNLAGIETELAPKMATGLAQRVLKEKVQPLLASDSASIQNPKSQIQNYDYVLMDCPPSLGLLTINALVLAREVIVPMQAHFLALQGLSKLLETVALIRRSFNPDIKVAGMVLCMHEGQTLLAGEVINDLKSFLEAARGSDTPWRDAVVYHPPVRRNIKLAESPSFGKSIFAYAPDCHGAADYLALAKHVDETAR
jgi:chromosome partitioning protein